MDTSDVAKGIQELLPEIRKRREEIEEARRMPRDLVDGLRKTGVFSLAVPRAVGGREASPLDLMRAIESVATSDGSAGWCTMIGSSGNIAAGYMPEFGAKEVFADPAAPTAGIAAPSGAATPVDGGVRVSGRWAFASGITHCDWVFAGCLVMENGKPRMTPHGPDILHVWLPVASVAVQDTWYVSGLRGTGSNDFSAADVFVPEQRTFRLLDPADHRKEPLYQMPPVGMFVYQVVCVSLGIARAALDELAGMAQTKVPTLYQQVLADKAVVQIDLARAEAELGSARAFLFETVEEMWQIVRSGGAPTPRQIAQGRMAATHAAETAARAARTASALAGGSAIYDASPMQRHARDSEAITHHFTVAPHSWEEAGRVLLGRQPSTPVF
jgi:alkylation response protein AidB-like acyl-CoA dehydrogenase